MRDKNGRFLKGHSIGLGKVVSDTTKEKIRKTLTGYKQSQETKNLLSVIRLGVGNSFFGKKHTEESRKKMSNSLKGRISPRKGVTISNETRKKLEVVWKANSGKGSHKWKGGISKARNYKRFKKMEYQGRKINNGGSHTKGDWEKLKKQYGYKCLKCGEKEPNIKLTEDHVVPLYKGGKDDISNIQPLCGKCNSSKNITVVDYRLTTLTCV